ncbi:MAG: phosphoadenylyl-sulfate reductase [Gammaproteobacteria bacterium]|nr:phosphoadenylyl-sulfate reductase [Gammaproteobacteria bacterium]|tara:strand:- start:347 stop:1063 length:717 start_codon:yes stop_codon:yes gene_type:complete
MDPRQATVNHTPQQVLKDALSRYEQGKIAISFSGAEDVVLLDMANQMGLAVDVFCLDTGRLHAQTYRFLETVRQHYNLDLELLMPQPEAVSELVRHKGLYSFYEDGHSECCAIRKIEPLRRKLDTLDAWITGQRRDQSVTRTNVPQEQEDQAFSTDEHTLIKFNPLADWSSADVWSYIRTQGVPYNELHDSGFVSIGCEPCTRAIAPHEHERAGRWWWEESTQKECGLHAQNVIKIVD